MKQRYLTAMMAVCFAVFVGCSAEAGKGDKKSDDKGTQTAAIGEIAPDFTLTDAEGDQHTLSDYRGDYVVLEWINWDCPFVKKHYGSGNMQTLQAAYKQKDVKWFQVCSSAPDKQGYYEGDELSNLIFQHHSQSTAYLIDDEGTVGKMYGAKTTPHMYIIDPEGTLIYAGGIDDRPTYNPQDIPKSTNFVRQALNAAMNEEEVEVKTAPPYGCSVKY